VTLTLLGPLETDEEKETRENRLVVVEILTHRIGDERLGAERTEMSLLVYMSSQTKWVIVEDLGTHLALDLV
jgi:hypothetical protein